MNLTKLIEETQNAQINGKPLSWDQKEARVNILNWLQSETPKPIFYLEGKAGMGKTSLILSICKDLINPKLLETSLTKKDILFAAYTGKAANNLTKNNDFSASTIHSLIYKRVEDSKTMEVTWELNDDSLLKNAKLLILDECSMVSNDIAKDLMSFNVPILFLGDEAQIAPFEGKGYFSSLPSDTKLEVIHRHSDESGIIELATSVREKKPLRKGNFKKVSVYCDLKINIKDIVNDWDQIICGKHKTRKTINERIRVNLGYSKNAFPVVGDKVICLKNSVKYDLYNGLIGTCTEVSTVSSAGVCYITFKSESGKLYENIPTNYETFLGVSNEESKNKGLVAKGDITDFDFGYAITCHKAQGSQWGSVLVLDDAMLVWDKEQRYKWLYTAITRAQDKVKIINYIPK